MDAPKYGARWSPLMKPSTTVRASRSSLPIRASTVGSTNRAPGIAPPSASLATSGFSEGGMGGRGWKGGEGKEICLPLTAPSCRSSPTCPSCPSCLHSRFRHSYRFEQLVHDLIGGDPFRLRAEVRQHAMPQHRMCHRPDVLEADVIAAVRERSGLAAEHQILRRTDAGAERHVLADQRGSLLRFRPTRSR